MVCGKEQISIENGSFIKLFCLLSRKFTIPPSFRNPLLPQGAARS